MNPKDYRLIVESKTCGIPCKLGVIEVGYYEPAYTRGHPDNWEPEDSCPHTYDILDRKGYRAKWLDAKCSTKDCDQHQLDIDKHLKEFANDY